MQDTNEVIAAEQEIRSFAPTLLEDQRVELIPIASIKIEERQRKRELKDIDAHVEGLAKSIQLMGLMHPVTIEGPDNNLVAGFCRTMAFMRLGLEKIPAIRRESLNKFERKICELDENIRRLQLEWYERAAAVAEINELYADLNPGWQQKDTAQMIGVDKATITRAVQITNAIREDPRLKEHKTLVGALAADKTKRQIEERKEAIATRAAAGTKTRGITAEILQGNCLDVLPSIEDESIDTIITNFPFGVDLTLKNHPQVYEDDPTEIDELVQRAVFQIHRVLKPDSWAVMFFATQKIPYTKSRLEFYELAISMARRLHQAEMVPDAFLTETIDLGTRSMGLQFWCQQAGFDYVSTTPPIWVKPNKMQGLIGDPKKGMIVAYEQFLFAAKGDPPLLKQGRQNIFTYDTPASGDRVHALQMPFDLCEELVRMTSLSGSLILDPFAGSGSIGVGALRAQCNFLGIELNPEYASNGNLILAEEMERLG